MCHVCEETAGRYWTAVEVYHCDQPSQIPQELGGEIQPRICEMQQEKQGKVHSDAPAKHEYILTV